MSTLANHAFIKMNGLGNEIVVVDMRGQAGTITADEARAAAQPDGAPYDQLEVELDRVGAVANPVVARVTG